MFELKQYKGEGPKRVKMVVLMHKHMRNENESER